MKRIIILFKVIMGLSYLHAQHEETPPLPLEDSGLIKLVKNASQIDFDTINQDEYSPTIEFDFNRRTELTDIQNAYSNPWNGDKELQISVLEIDGEFFTIEGQSFIKKISNRRIVLGKTTYYAKCIEIEENYSLNHNGISIADYTGNYFSFIDSTKLLYEVYTKQQFLVGGLGQYYEGVSYNMMDSIQYYDINLTLNPNPATNQYSVDATFELWKTGNVTINIAKQNGLSNKIVFTGQLQNGLNTQTINIMDLHSGLYVVNVLYENRNFSSTLIIQ